MHHEAQKSQVTQEIRTKIREQRRNEINETTARDFSYYGSSLRFNEKHNAEMLALIYKWSN
jgi:hypothetical protein